MLRKAGVDTRRRKIIWNDGQRLSTTQSARRIHVKYPHLTLDLIEDRHVARDSCCRDLLAGAARRTGRAGRRMGNRSLSSQGRSRQKTSNNSPTTLRVRDNETIVLGGLLRGIDSETVTKLPYLADIPILGKIFQNREHTHQRDEIVFLITPHILGQKGTAAPRTPRGGAG